MRIHNRVIVLGLLLTLGTAGCNVIREIQSAATNLSRCKFKLAGVSDFSIAGIALSGKSNFSVSDGVTLAASFAHDELPASFTINVSATNPNDGTGGTSQATATLTSFAWTLLIDSTTTITGNIPSPITIPAAGQQTIIPLRMNLDLVTFFRQKGYNSILNLALALGGANGSPSRLTLRARPTVSTEFGPLTYPGDINIVDKEFR